MITPLSILIYLNQIPYLKIRLYEYICLFLDGYINFSSYKVLMIWSLAISNIHFEIYNILLEIMKSWFSRIPTLRMI